MEQIRIDLVPGGVTPNAHASQYDVGRAIRFLLYNGGSAYTLAGTETITVDVTKPDGTTDTVSVTNTSSNYVDFVTTDGLLNQAGLYPCEISIVDGGTEIGSQNFNLRAEADAYDGADIVTVTVGPADICTFTTTLAEPLQSVLVNVEATGGNGTPNNPNPINGYTEANITRCGVNLLHVDSRVSQTTAQVIYTSDDNYLYLNGTKSGGGYADLTALTVTLPKGTYYLKAFVISGTASNTVELYAFDGSSNLTGSLLSGERTLTLTETQTFRFRFAIWSDGTVCTNYKIGIAISTESGISDFTEYNGNAYTIAFGQTVYGGVLDVTRGKLTVTHLVKDFGDMTWTTSSATNSTRRMHSDDLRSTAAHPDSPSVVGSIKCSCYDAKSANATYVQTEGISIDNGGSIDVYDPDYNTSDAVSAFKTARTGQKILYELATPFDIDLTPEVISALALPDSNNVFADCGETTVKYLKAGA